MKQLHIYDVATHLTNLTKKQPRMDRVLFNRIHTDFIVPLTIKVDIPSFLQQVIPYQHVFRRWGNTKHDFPRYGAPLVNLTGSMCDQVDPSCWPLDKWCATHPDTPYWETDFKQPTELLGIESLAVFDPIKPYMIRSNILLWHRDGFFSPHVDMYNDTITHLRLWGVTTDASGYELVYGDTVVTNFEPGRLYLINTIEKHSARALCDNVYTFFLAVDLKILNILPNLMLMNYG